MGCRSPCAPLPARLPFFYGWVIVGMFIIDMVLCSTWPTMLLNMLTMGPLYQSWEDDGVSRVQVSLMFSIGTLCAALMAPMAGRAVDRFGGQVMMPVALCVIGAGMLMIALTPTSLPWLLAPTFLLARGGAKCMTSPYRPAVLNQWFEAKRGKATATIMITNQCLTNFIVCPLYGQLLLTWGWRKASFLGFVLNVVAAPFFGLLLFHTPESVGLLPDGLKKYSRIADDEHDDSDDDTTRPNKLGAITADRPPERKEEVFSFTLAEAFRTLPVWLLMFDGFCGAIIGVGCSQSLLQTLDDNGAVGVVISVHVVFANGAAQMVQPLLAGYARDHGVPPRYILGLSAAFVATVPFLQTQITSPFYAVLYGKPSLPKLGRNCAY